MAFDPYCEWLAVPPGRRPPDFYELLGVSRFESDAERIRLACLARSASVRRFCLGPHGSDANRLLGELAAALACLSDPDEKASYDHSLGAASPPAETGEVADAALPPVQYPPDAARTAANAAQRSSPANSPAGESLRIPRGKARVSARFRGRIARAAHQRTARITTAIFLAAPMLLIALVVATYFRSRPAAEASAPAPTVPRNDSPTTGNPQGEAAAAAETPSTPAAFEPPENEKRQQRSASVSVTEE